jgi:hypothetical protein
VDASEIVTHVGDKNDVWYEALSTLIGRHNGVIVHGSGSQEQRGPS